MRAINLEILRLAVRQLKETLKQKRLSTRGDIDERQDQSLRASLREVKVESAEIPWYVEDQRERADPEKESTSEEELVE